MASPPRKNQRAPLTPWKIFQAALAATLAATVTSTAREIRASVLQAASAIAVSGANTAYEAWAPQGLFYRTSPTRAADTADTSLWLWLGGERTRMLATDLRWDAPARLVLPVP